MLKQIAKGAPTNGFILAKGEHYAEEKEKNGVALGLP
jgi:hypothetical protein